ncbi:MAG: dihydrodipicolinate synthase family protein [Bacteroides sp.]
MDAILSVVLITISLSGGMYQHYKVIAEVLACRSLYNVPGRTGVNMTAETTLEARAISTISLP